MTLEQICTNIQDVPDFPKKGIVFKDITPIFEQPKVFKALTKHMVESLHPETTKLVAIESRGFLFAMAMSQHCDLPIVLARKPGKLPRETYTQDYELEYGTDSIEIHKDSLSPGDHITIVDDIIATGGTAEAVEKLCLSAGTKVVQNLFFMELSFLKGAQKLSAPVTSLVKV